jgi:hypothetical protein
VIEAPQAVPLGLNSGPVATMVMPLNTREKPGSWQVEKEHIHVVIYVICIFVVTSSVVSLIRRPDAAADTHATVEHRRLHRPTTPANASTLDYFVLERYFTV